ncbi:isochorismatase family protein [Peribacillus frigoritolerans]|uniref:isochorismatase family protein n=1 Tax=Peribacillus frigoritolerans TaxID=450367 RepID=UPI00300BB333
MIIGGVLTDCCVLATVLDAYYRDYQVNLVKDICETTILDAHMSAILKTPLVPVLVLRNPISMYLYTVTDSESLRTLYQIPVLNLFYETFTR